MNKRAFVSFLMFFSLVALIPSGIMLHLTSLEAFGPTRHLLMSVHNISMMVLLISASIHLAFNYRTMISCLKSRAAVHFRPSREAVFAMTTLAVLITAAILHVFLLG